MQLSELGVVCIIIDLTATIVFAIMALFFVKSNGKAAKYVSGYNWKSLDERRQYDEKQICVDLSCMFIIYSIVFSIGAVLDLFMTGFGSIAAWILFVILLIINLFNYRNEKFDLRYKIK